MEAVPRFVVLRFVPPVIVRNAQQVRLVIRKKAPSGRVESIPASDKPANTIAIASNTALFATWPLMERASARRFVA
jgi:hypothetical protein